MKARMPAGFGRPDMNALMRQAQKMQKELQKAQQEIAEMTFEGTAGGGMVTAVARGDKSIESLTINPDVVDPEDVEMLQDLILSAVNEAVRLANETMEKEMSKVTGGLGNLGGFGF